MTLTPEQLDDIDPYEPIPYDTVKHLVAVYRAALACVERLDDGWHIVNGDAQATALSAALRGTP